MRGVGAYGGWEIQGIEPCGLERLQPKRFEQRQNVAGPDPRPNHRIVDARDQITGRARGPRMASTSDVGLLSAP